MKAAAQDENSLTPQERHAAECAAKAVLKEWRNGDPLDLSSMLNAEIAKAVRVTSSGKDCA